MKHPQVIVLEADGWLARQLGELAGEGRWLVRSVRSADAALAAARERSPAVLLVQFEPGEDRPNPLALIADAHRLAPDVPVVAVSDTKLNDADRAAWGAAVLDLGARYVLFPPVTKVVLEDVVSGLMAAAVRRVVGAGPGDAARPKRPPARRAKVIDLADEDLEA
jgi:hypothetical protein